MIIALLIVAALAAAIAYHYWSDDDTHLDRLRDYYSPYDDTGILKETKNERSYFNARRRRSNNDTQLK